MAPYSAGPASDSTSSGGTTTYMRPTRRQRRRARRLAAAETQPPLKAEGAAGQDELCGQQQIATIGQPVPIVFARRIGNRGGIMLSPRATDARFTNDTSNTLTASYHLILGDGPMGSVQVRDVYQCTCRVGTFTQTYNQRAGNWEPGNNLVVRAGYTLQDVPDYCGSKGTAEGLSTMSFTNTYPDGSSDWNRQVQAFIRSGRTVARLADGATGPSSNFADLFRLGMETGARLPASMLDTARLQIAALFCDANQFYCDIEIKESNNLGDFVSQLAPYFLLRETRILGRRGLRPLLPLDAAFGIKTDPIAWRFEFNEDYILPGSIQIQYTPLEERKPVLMIALWRQQPENGFGIVQSAEVGYPGDRESGNIEQHDMSAFCTHELHAVRAMAYRRSRRRWSTHTATWSCRPEVYNRLLEEGDIVRLTFTRNASDGSVSVHDFLYQLDQITKSPTGEIEFQATHFPVDAEGRSMIALDVIAAQTQGHAYTTIRTGLDCDDDSGGDRESDTSVPASVGQSVAPGEPPAPPTLPPALPPSPTPPTPPGGSPPPPPAEPPADGYPPPDPCESTCGVTERCGTPENPPACLPGEQHGATYSYTTWDPGFTNPSPVLCYACLGCTPSEDPQCLPPPEPPDELPPDPCLADCINELHCGVQSCPAGSEQVGTYTDNGQTCLVCRVCRPTDPNCYPLDCCTPQQVAAGYQCSTVAYIDMYVGPPGGGYVYTTLTTKTGALSSTLLPNNNWQHTYINTCGVSVTFLLFTNTDSWYTVRRPASGFITGCFPC